MLICLRCYFEAETQAVSLAIVNYLFNTRHNNICYAGETVLLVVFHIAGR